MRKVTRAALALAGSAALIGVTTVPSFAADSPVTVTVADGGISISAPNTGPTFTTSDPDALLDATATATLAETKVTDLRHGETPWTATVSLPNLSDGAATPKTISTSTATYLAGTATVVGTATVTAPTKKTDLSTAAVTSQATSSVTGNNSAAWTATLTVDVPAATLIEAYAGTVTQSVV